MYLHDLKPAKGTKKNRKRLGRGQGSGLGTTAGRGTKGQKSRTGSKVYPWYEGGQIPITRRLPKRGFNNKRFSKEYEIVNIDVINDRFNEGEEVSIESLKSKGLIKKDKGNVKILGKGELTKKLIFKINIMSKNAKDKIEKSNSSIES
ncbi:MAG: 50S ribosomal protein L15 [Deferribacterota bacterium]|nr:50S ribosomal protein L15 [Deferribacterota bacterium]